MNEQAETLRARALGALHALPGADAAEAVAFQGAIGRGQADDRSDVDVILAFAGDASAHSSARGERVLDGLKWSVFHLSLDRVEPKRWSDKQRYAYGFETQVIRDDRGRLASLCRRAHLGPHERTARLIHGVKKLANRGITYRGAMGGWRGFDLGDRADTWIRRGDPYAAHARLEQAHRLLVDVLFALAGRPVPSEKIRHHLVAALPRPGGHAALLHEIARVARLDEDEFERRRGAAVELLSRCVDEADARGHLPEDLGRVYRSAYPSHSDDTE
jgi:predicted nucleotidyltransferase